MKKKLIAAVMTGAMAMSLAACGGGAPASTSAGSTPAAETKSESAAAEAAVEEAATEAAAEAVVEEAAEEAAAEAVVEEIQTQDVKLKKDVSLMRGLQSKVSQIASQTDDASIKALAEEFRYSDPVSNDAIADAEADLAAAVDQLQAAYIDGDQEAMNQLCRKTTALLAERNRLCKLNKN